MCIRMWMKIVKASATLFIALISLCIGSLSAAANTVGSSSHIELLSPYLQADCVQRDSIDAWEKKYIDDAEPLTFAAYNSYFKNDKYDIRTLVRHGINSKEFRHSKNTIRGVEQLSNVHIENIDGLRYRYEGVVGARWRPIPKYQAQLYVNFESPERVSIWRDDCKAFLLVKTIGQYVQYDPEVYDVRYQLDRKVRKPKLDSNLKSGTPALRIEGWTDAKRVIVMRTCYENSHPTDDYLDIICTEHSLSDPGISPDVLLIRGVEPGN